MDFIRSKMKEFRIDLLIRALLMLVLGVIFFIDPVGSTVISAYLIGIFILVDGIFSLVLFIFGTGVERFFKGSLLGSLVEILIGVLAISNANSFANVLVYFFAIYFIFDSCVSLEAALYFREIKADGWIVSVILAVISIALGVAMLFMAPYDLKAVFGYFAGASLIYGAINNIYLLIKMYQLHHKVKDIVIDVSNDQK